MLTDPSDQKTVGQLSYQRSRVPAAEFAAAIEQEMDALDRHLCHPSHAYRDRANKNDIRKRHLNNVFVRGMCMYLAGQADNGERVDDGNWQSWLDENFAVMNRWRVKPTLIVYLMIDNAVHALKTGKQFSEHDWTPEDRAVSAVIDAARRNGYWSRNSWRMSVREIGFLLKAPEHHMLTQYIRDVHDLGGDIRCVADVGRYIALRGDELPEQAHRIVLDDETFRGIGEQIAIDAFEQAVPDIVSSINSYSTIRALNVGRFVQRLRAHKSNQSGIPSPLTLLSRLRRKADGSESEWEDKKRLGGTDAETYQQDSRNLAAVFHDFIVADHETRWQSASVETVKRDCARARDTLMRACWGTSNLYISEVLDDQLEETALKQHATALFDDDADDEPSIGPALG